MKGLIIDEPWISKILDGIKTWEMRSTRTSQRGQFALIRKGSGAVVGVANINGTTGPLSLHDLRANMDRHRVPVIEFESGRAMKWTTAWLLSGAQALPRPVPYRHPLGAVTWVNLDPGVEALVQAQLDGVSIASAESLASQRDQPSRESLDVGPYFSLDPACLVPIASDGTWFGPHLLRAGEFTIGAKGEEKKVDSYEEALQELGAMDVARWRRPNPRGNWGIVSGVEWVQSRDVQRGVPD
jgi:hypothetical protein